MWAQHLAVLQKNARVRSNHKRNRHPWFDARASRWLERKRLALDGKVRFANYKTVNTHSIHQSSIQEKEKQEEEEQEKEEQEEEEQEEKDSPTERRVEVINWHKEETKQSTRKKYPENIEQHPRALPGYEKTLRRETSKRLQQIRGGISASLKENAEDTEYSAAAPENDKTLPQPGPSTCPNSKQSEEDYQVAGPEKNPSTKHHPAVPQHDKSGPQPATFANSKQFVEESPVGSLSKSQEHTEHPPAASDRDKTLSRPASLVKLRKLPGGKEESPSEEKPQRRNSDPHITPWSPERVLERTEASKTLLTKNVSCLVKY